jgi:hypothetical protein
MLLLAALQKLFGSIIGLTTLISMLAKLHRWLAGIKFAFPLRNEEHTHGLVAWIADP